MKPLHLALQGGGSHGAFTWGVLDAILEARAVIPVLTGSSAGAVNAVALASGWSVAARSGADRQTGAREALRRVWEEVMGLGVYGSVQRQWLSAWVGTASLIGWPGGPALSFHPLQNLLQRHVDFAALQDSRAPAVHLGATHVRSGRAKIFRGTEVTLDAVLASTCLPTLFPTALVDGEAYWDGGYSINPPLSPFLAIDGPIDVLLVQINPMCSAVPASMHDVQQRAQELAFNASLLSQVRTVAHANQLVALGLLPARRLIRLHRIGGSEELLRFPPSSRASADAGMILELFSLGREAAARWIAAHAADVGIRATLDAQDYADDTWLRLGALASGAGSWRQRAIARWRGMLEALRHRARK
ncbi:patatin-like phospholipase family protein [Ramlibacter sp. RBP-2]|uniref:Patatin-like phospholipase family protein n=1 Tax=Ramlibacter lithotrophicus TaxID=2606681 RepID=A0A7X6DIW4_9BURK|nr:patatin-like phospholipase family protein [Ramlibacter lithotrophicus]NKE68002.1 patatin-like phospholipase family protein [Ramlibacter lithotrophicus]